MTNKEITSNINTSRLKAANAVGNQKSKKQKNRKNKKMNTENNNGMTVEQILEKNRVRNSVKGPRPHLNVNTILEKHGERLDINELNEAITKLTARRNENLKWHAMVQSALAAQAKATAEAAQALVTNTEAPVTA